MAPPPLLKRPGPPSAAAKDKKDGSKEGARPKPKATKNEVTLHNNQIQRGTLDPFFRDEVIFRLDCVFCDANVCNLTLNCLHGALHPNVHTHGVSCFCNGFLSG